LVLKPQANGSPISWQQRTARGTWRAARIFFIAYLLVCLLMTFLETWLVYPIPPKERGDWIAAGLEHEEVRFVSVDGTKLHGWFVPHPQSKRAILYCHGNGNQVADNVDLMARLRDRLQASVMIFDYRGYGRSDGTPHEEGLVADGLAAQRWLADRMGIATEDILVMGRSIGGGVAVAIAADQGARALVLESTFSRMVDVAAQYYPWLPIRLLMRNRYDSIARIQKYSGPVFQSHGTADSIVPIAFAHKLYDAIPTDAKQFYELPGFGHNDYPQEEYYTALSKFLMEHAH